MPHLQHTQIQTKHLAEDTTTVSPVPEADEHLQSDDSKEMPSQENVIH